MLQLPEKDSSIGHPRKVSRTAAQILAGDMAVLAAMKRLEYGLADLVQLTSIAGTLVESYGNQAINVEKTAWTAKQAMAELKKTGDQLMFMVYEVEQKALALRDEWEAAASAGDHTFPEPEEHCADANEVDGLTASSPSRRASA
ncbi:hypothetical protein SAMN05216374_1004 [Tardiphaga sp. OK246]|uniref:hypothetical protein n=1 Tax=Tardiphaga sp. OK246 TaxID=1855307 RepID=UPI000B6243AD|nr:hypothetical protein [Tardiphaga sp. OK246]SNS36834.1 hypothetical protein SAMN05216374_1004 [Tardiphaga sp. OK246]